MIPQEFLSVMNSFEERNNLSIAISICSDGSGTVLEFWENGDLEHFESTEELMGILKNSNYKKGENGLCISPIEKIRNIMKILVKKDIEVEVVTLKVSAGVRYWEDSTVNGVNDEAGDLIPCRNGDYWEPEINLLSGQIKGWETGKTADIHYKVCDDGKYSLIDTDGNVALALDGYVPKIMCPEENGYGDYIIMKIDERGFIANWRTDFDSFTKQD